MSAGVFLLAVAGLVLALIGYEMTAWFTGKLPTLSFLAYHHPLVRWAILAAVALFGAWWVAHSAQPAPR